MYSSWALLIATVLAAGSHILYFIHGEHHMKASLLASLIPVCVMLLAVVQVPHNTFLQALQYGFRVTHAYATGLYSSIVIYRLFLHPLQNFPGPPLAKISKLWHAYKILDRRNHTSLEELHERYGDIVRTGKKEKISLFLVETDSKLQGQTNSSYLLLKASKQSTGCHPSASRAISMTCCRLIDLYMPQEMPNSTVGDVAFSIKDSVPRLFEATSRESRYKSGAL